MRINIKAKPAFSLMLTLEQLDLLIIMSEHHYDGACKQLSHNKSLADGMLLGWKRNVEHAIASVGTDHHYEGWCYATFRELDLLLKVCENTLCIDRERRAEMILFAADVRAALDLANKQISPLLWELK